MRCTERNSATVSVINHFSKVFHDDALAEKISCPDNASVHLLNTALVHLPEEFQQLPQNNSGGTGAQSDDTEDVDKRVALAEWFSKLAEKERSEDGHCWSAIRMKELTTGLQDRFCSSATVAYQSETLNLCVQLAKQDDSKLKAKLVRIGDGECHLPLLGRIIDLKTIVKV